MNSSPWVLLDTETTGFRAPIFVVELAAQRMRGWSPDGPPFRRILNHNVDIPPEASRVNGFTREILERDGEPPDKVYADFAAYVEQQPLVSYNLSFDLDQVLLPEWERLGIAPIGSRGLCALRLTQRLLDPVPAGNCKLQTLRQYYRLPERGAHTALGDVETVVDLMSEVLRPLAEQRRLRTWEQLSSYAAETWFPSRIAFGKFKGRSFRDAHHDPELHDWLRWLAGSRNARSGAAGRWYLDQLGVEADDSAAAASASFVSSAGPGVDGDLVLYVNPELEVLRQLVAGARTRLADLEAEYTQERHSVEVVQAQLLSRLRPHYQKRDRLWLLIQYRRRYLDTLLVAGEEEAETLKPEYERDRAETEREYQEAVTQAAETKALSDEEQGELKRLFRKLVRLFHPDRFAHQPELLETYQQLTEEINLARDRGDIQRLREIANDPNGFLMRRGFGTLNFDDDAELTKLRQLYETLQARIISTLEELAELRESSDYELYRLSRERPDVLDEIAESHKEAIAAEIAELEAEAQQLAEEIENLTEREDPFDAE